VKIEEEEEEEEEEEAPKHMRLFEDVLFHCFKPRSEHFVLL
jgi:hypothetical protein